MTNNGASWTRVFTPPFTGNGWTTFGEDINGEIYIAGNDSGTVYKIIDPSFSVGENNAVTVKLFPNPASDEVHINISNSTTSIQTVTLYDIQGHIITSESNLERPSTTISTKHLSRGMYFVHVTDRRGKSIVQKLIKN